MKGAAPLRFLALVLGGWICIRAAILAPTGTRPRTADATAEPVATTSILPPAQGRIAAYQPPLPIPVQSTANRLALKAPASRLRGSRADRPGSHPGFSIANPALSILGPILSADGDASPSARQRRFVDDVASLAPAASGAVPPVPGPIAATPAVRRAGRWSGSAWALLHDDRGQATLAPGGTLGGSQTGARILYRIGGGLALGGRFYAPLRRPGGAEAAAGIDWRPWPRLPVHLLAERRQGLGGAGRSAFALTLYGGASGHLPAGLRGEAYAQAGIVGLESRDPFVDGSVRIGLPVGRVEVGAGGWGAAQAGAARLDAGPWVAYRLPVRGANLRLQADWRIRIAGDAAPGSGPALTLAADFR